jgi:hypothetical protein
MSNNLYLTIEGLIICEVCKTNKTILFYNNYFILLCVEDIPKDLHIENGPILLD